MRKLSRAVPALVGVAAILAALAPSALAAPARTGTHQSASAGSPSGYKLVYAPARQVTCTYTRNWQVTNKKVTGWTYYELLPPTRGRQDITLTMAPDGKEGTTQGNVQRPLLYTKATDPSSQLSVAMTFQGTLNDTRLMPLKPGEVTQPVELSDSEKQFLTKATASLDYDSPAMRAWIDTNGLHRRSGESDLDLGRRVFMAVRANFKYSLKCPRGQRKASDILRDKVTVCVGLAWVFTATMRADGVPTRAMNLQEARHDYSGSGVGAGHCNTEFYCHGIGWVPADPTGGVMSTSDQEALRFFGNDDGAFLILFDGGNDFSVDMTRLGQNIAPGSSAGSDRISRGAFWGVHTDSGTPKTADTWVNKVTVLPRPSVAQTQPVEACDASGQPPASVAGGQAGYFVWHDPAGWHVHSSTDGANHGWCIEVDPIAPTAVQAGATGAAAIPRALYEIGIITPDGTNADIRPTNKAVKTLCFQLSLDGVDAPPERIWIGSKGAHPRGGAFRLANGPFKTGPRPVTAPDDTNADVGGQVGAKDN